MCLFFCFEEKEEGWANVGLRARFSFIAIYVFKGVCKITMQTLHSNHTSRWKSNCLAVYSLCLKPYINYTLNNTWQTIKSPSTTHKPDTATLHFVLKTNERMEFRTRISRISRISRMERLVRLEQIVRNVCNERNERDERDERNERDVCKTGNGNRWWHASSLRFFLSLTPWLFLSLSLWLFVSPSRRLVTPCAPLQKSNNFERIFSDLTLTFLTYRNTFRLPILPIRRAVFLCLPQI